MTPNRLKRWNEHRILYLLRGRSCKNHQLAVTPSNRFVALIHTTGSNWLILLFGAFKDSQTVSGFYVGLHQKRETESKRKETPIPRVDVDDHYIITWNYKTIVYFCRLRAYASKTEINRKRKKHFWEERGRRAATEKNLNMEKKPTKKYKTNDDNARKTQGKTDKSEQIYLN